MDIGNPTIGTVDITEKVCCGQEVYRESRGRGKGHTMIVAPIVTRELFETAKRLTDSIITATWSQV